MPDLYKVFFSEDGSVLFFLLDVGVLEWVVMPDIESQQEAPAEEEE